MTALLQTSNTTSIASTASVGTLPESQIASVTDALEAIQPTDPNYWVIQPHLAPDPESAIRTSFEGEDKFLCEPIDYEAEIRTRKTTHEPIEVVEGDVKNKLFGI